MLASFVGDTTVSVYSSWTSMSIRVRDIPTRSSRHVSKRFQGRGALLKLTCAR